MDDLFDICIEAPLTCNEHIFLCWLHSIPIHKTCDYIINNNDHFTKQNQQNNSTSIKNAKSMNSESVDREQGAVSIDNEPNDTNRKNINNELDDNMSSANANTSDNIAYPHLLFRCHNRLTHNNMYMATHDSETNTNINQNKRALPLSSTLNKQLLTLEIKDHYKCYNLFEYYLQRPSLLIQITIGNTYAQYGIQSMFTNMIFNNSQRFEWMLEQYYSLNDHVVKELLIRENNTSSHLKKLNQLTMVSHHVSSALLHNPNAVPMHNSSNTHNNSGMGSNASMSSTSSNPNVSAGQGHSVSFLNKSIRKELIEILDIVVQNQQQQSGGASVNIQMNPNQGISALPIPTEYNSVSTLIRQYENIKRILAGYEDHIKMNGLINIVSYLEMYWLLPCYLTKKYACIVYFMLHRFNVCNKKKLLKLKANQYEACCAIAMSLLSCNNQEFSDCVRSVYQPYLSKRQHMQQLQQSDHPTGDGLKLEVNMYVPPFLLNNLITKSITDAHDNATRNISITSTNDKKAWKLIYQLMSLNGSMDSNQMLLLSLVEIKQKIISINTHNNASNHLNTSNVHHGGMNMSASIATASNGPPSIPQQLSASNIALNPNGAEYHGNVPLVHAQSNPIPISSYGAHQTTAKTVQLPNLNKAIGMVLTNLKELGCHHIVTIMQPFDRMAQFIKNLITMGALLTNTKDFRDLFEDIVTKIVEPLEYYGLSITHMNTLLLSALHVVPPLDIGDGAMLHQNEFFDLQTSSNVSMANPHQTQHHKLSMLPLHQQAYIILRSHWIRYVTCVRLCVAAIG